ncbi:MAG: biopolymer transporter ExbD [Myxococcales bacterium]|nr:biopolymer transporter ExbD [Myxococcales bacterium]
MAGVSIGGGGGGRRALDSEINMIPMIDLLMVTISFLLITAVWTHMSRLPASAQVPGASATDPCAEPGKECPVERRLHVETKDPGKFVLVWREGQVAMRSVDVPRTERVQRAGDQRVVAYPELAARVAEEWKREGAHRAATDDIADSAVVHASNDMAYASLVGVMDAVAHAKRPLTVKGKTEEVSAFRVTLAAD